MEWGKVPRRPREGRERRTTRLEEEQETPGQRQKSKGERRGVKGSRRSRSARDLKERSEIASEGSTGV